MFYVSGAAAARAAVAMAYTQGIVNSQVYQLQLVPLPIDGIRHVWPGR